ncbi:Condensation domain [Legionella sainthelensi]|uniref:condensation domain-containing protein n=1 Tax=Legionella sainthelensi TaxID=28087 RepID=UPI000F704995|nr:condensation domain-containing protein [Legionella sainthelensi]VEB38460.1 Condensation domain [Legionella sainthelensi]
MKLVTYPIMSTVNYYYPSLEVSRLEKAINYLIKEYPVLRTVYSYEQLQQRFLSLDETPYYSVKVNDYRHLAGDEKDLQPIRERLSHQVYDPQSFPLFAFEVTQFRTMWGVTCEFRFNFIGR